MAHRSIPKSLSFLCIFCLLASCWSLAASSATSSGSTSTSPGQASTSSTTVSSSGGSTGAGSGPGISGSIPPGYYAQPYSAALQSSFGTPPYTYTLTGGGLPPGVTMNSAGKITGTPGANSAIVFASGLTGTIHLNSALPTLTSPNANGLAIQGAGAITSDAKLGNT